MASPTRSFLLFLAVTGIALALAHLLDRAAYAYLYDPHVYDHGLGRMLRTTGFLPVWMFGAAALALHDRGAPDARDPRAWRRGWHRALLLLFAPALAGGAAELLKLVIRRERPWAHGGAYVFRPWSDRPLYSGGLSMPSSEVAVAFGAAFVLARLFPRTAPVWLLLAVGCALTRVAVRAHFLSDVTLGAIVAWAVIAGLWRWYRRRTDGRPSEKVATNRPSAVGSS